jgi:hypothetical protein
MRQADWQSLMANFDDCPRLSHDERVKHGIAPNDLYFQSPRRAILVCKRSASGEDFSVSAGGIKYCIDLENETVGVQGYLLFINRDGSYVNHTTIREFARRMNGHQLRPSEDPRFGKYWWSDSDFNFAGYTSRNANIVQRAPWLQAND